MLSLFLLHEEWIWSWNRFSLSLSFSLSDPMRDTLFSSPFAFFMVCNRLFIPMPSSPFSSWKDFTLFFPVDSLSVCVVIFLLQYPLLFSSPSATHYFSLWDWWLSWNEWHRFLILIFQVLSQEYSMRSISNELLYFVCCYYTTHPFALNWDLVSCLVCNEMRKKC